MELVAEKYKQTEVGLIPSDWEVKTIGDIFTFYSTSNFSKVEMTLDGEVGCVHYGLIHAIDNTRFSLKNGVKYYVTKEQAKYETLQDGDVVMVDASEDLVGLNKSVEVSGINNKKFIAGLHTFHLRDKDKTYIESLRGLVLNSDAVKKQMLRVAVGMKVFGVSKPQLQQILVPVPTKAEQTAIANALSDADTLISSLEKLIAKKRMIKQGAMQQLLKPKEGWEVKKLGDSIRFQTGFPFPSENFTTNPQGMRLIKNRDLRSDDSIVFYSGEFHKEFVVENGDLLIGMDGDFEPVLWKNGKALLNQRVGRVIKIKEISIPFLSYVLIKELKEIELRTSSTTVKHLSHSDIERIEMLLPSAEEQTRIATILSDMDAEINALETKLEKYKKVKLGMMQNLLTGKIRLV